MENLIKEPGSISAYDPALVQASHSPSRMFSAVFAKVLPDIIAIYDIAAIFMSGFLAHHVYRIFSSSDFPLDLSYFSVMALVAVSYRVLAVQGGLYDATKMVNFTSQISSLIYAWISTYSIALFVLFFLKISDVYSRIWFAEWSVLSLVFLGIGRTLLARRFNVMAQSGLLRRHVALIGSGSQFRSASERLNDDSTHFALLQSCDLSSLDFSSPIERDNVLRAFIAAARRCEADEIVIALPAERGHFADEILHQLQILPVDVHVLPDFGGCEDTIHGIETGWRFIVHHHRIKAN